MASHPPFSLLLLLFTLFSLLNPRSRAAKLPFHPDDVLPLPPRQLSWPILNALPPSPGPVAHLRQRRFCLRRLSGVERSLLQPENGFGWSSTTRPGVSSAEERFTPRYPACNHESGLPIQVKSRGVSIFLMQAGMLGTLQALWDVFPLFSKTGWWEKSNIGFLKKHMGASFEQCPQPWVTNISIDDIRSGDFLAISKIRGSWGGFETLEKWVSGAYAGVTA